MGIRATQLEMLEILGGTIHGFMECWTEMIDEDLTQMIEDQMQKLMDKVRKS